MKRLIFFALIFACVLSAQITNVQLGNSPGGQSSTVTLNYTLAGGASTMSAAAFYISNAGFGAFGNSCAIEITGIPGQWFLYLWNPSNNSWTGGAGQTQLSNSVCTVSNPSIAFSGNVASYTVSISLVSGYALPSNINAWGETLQSQIWGWNTIGVWSASAGPPTYTVTPSGAVTLGAPTSFHAVIIDPNGANDVNWGQVLLSNQLVYASSCALWMGTIGGPPLNNLWLINDAGTGWLGPINPGGSLSNSACGVTFNASQTSGNTVSWDFSVLPAGALSLSGTMWSAMAAGNVVTQGWTGFGTYTMNTVTSQAMAVDVQDTGLDDSSGLSATMPSPNNPAPAGLERITVHLPTRGGTVSFPSAATGMPLTQFNSDWAEESGKFKYTYHLDNTGVWLFRISDDPDAMNSSEKETYPKGWSPFGAAFGEGPYPDKSERSANAEYTVLSAYRPGLVPVFFQNRNGADMPYEPDTRDGRAIVDRSVITVDSAVRFGIGPAFKPGATKADVMAIVGHWVKDFKYDLLEPFLEGSPLGSLEPQTDLDRQVISCLQLELKRVN